MSQGSEVALSDSYPLQPELADAFAALAPKARQVFLLSRVRRMTYPQIARHCGISVKMVEQLIGRALAAAYAASCKFKTTARLSAPTIEEAARWCARLSAPDCSNDDRADFSMWRLRDPSHRQAYLAVHQLAEAAAQLGRSDTRLMSLTNYAFAAGRGLHVQRSLWSTPHRAVLPLGVAASVLLAVVFMFLAPHVVRSSEKGRSAVKQQEAIPQAAAPKPQEAVATPDQPVESSSIQPVPVKKPGGDAVVSSKF